MNESQLLYRDTSIYGSGVTRVTYTMFNIQLRCYTFHTMFNPFKPEFTIVIFIHYTPRIDVAILDLKVDENDLKKINS